MKYAQPQKHTLDLFHLQMLPLCAMICVRLRYLVTEIKSFEYNHCDANTKTDTFRLGVSKFLFFCFNSHLLTLRLFNQFPHLTLI